MVVIGDVMITRLLLLLFLFFAHFFVFYYIGRPTNTQTHPKLVLNFLPFCCWVLLVFGCKHTHSRLLVIFSFFIAIKVEQDIQLVCSVLYCSRSILFCRVELSFMCVHFKYNDFLIFCFWLIFSVFFLICHCHYGFSSKQFWKGKGKKKQRQHTERVYLLSKRVIEFNGAEKTFNSMDFSFPPSLYFKNKKKTTTILLLFPLCSNRAFRVT